MKGTSRVAHPRQTISTPLASGSRVPAWPTRFVPARRATISTTRREDIPEGLLTISRPTMIRGCRNLPSGLSIVAFRSAKGGVSFAERKTTMTMTRSPGGDSALQRHLQALLVMVERGFDEPGEDRVRAVWLGFEFGMKLYRQEP